MKDACILCRRYYDYSGTSISIGGIQTYINKLSSILNEIYDNVIIFQYADRAFVYQDTHATIIGVDVSEYKHNRQRSKKLYYEFKKKSNIGSLLIYATEDLITDRYEGTSICLQHGISWDIKVSEKQSNILFFKDIIRSALFACINITKITKADNIVCVDYNYLNWFRALVKNYKSKIIVIPNFTDFPRNVDVQKKQISENINILFARRFVEYRGTKLFAQVSSKILERYENVYITFAGEGPDEEWLKTHFADNPRVIFTKYESSQSLKMHEEMQIAVVPTIGSEGTSLSLLEAMASGCAVVCTNVGGMTNIILDEYNGLMVSPDYTQLYSAINRLVIDLEMRIKIAQNARDCIEQAFSYDIWAEKWRTFLLSLRKK